MRRAARLVASCVALVAAAADARGAPRVTLVEGAASVVRAEVETQIRGELLGEGFDVGTWSSREALDGSFVAHAHVARDTASFALVAVRVSTEGVGAEVWIDDPHEPGGALRAIETEPSSPDAPRVLAIRVAELLRAAFVEIAAGRAAPPTPARAAAEAPAPSAASRPAPAPATSATKGALVVGAAAARRFADVSTTFAPLVGASWRVSRSLALEARWTGPARATVRVDSASATVTTVAARAGVRLGLEPRVGGVAPFATLAAGVARTRAEGDVPRPWVSTDATSWDVVGVAAAGAALRVSDAWTASAELAAEVAGSSLEVAFPDGSRASLGRGAVALGAAVAWGF